MMHDQTMRVLKQHLSVVADKIPPSARTVYLDIPMHLNIGDQLIDWGAQVFLKEKGLTPALRLSAYDVARFQNRIGRDDVILLHGGGNMNEIWPLHENLRQHVVKSFPHNKILVLPQLVHFENAEKAKTLLGTYASHGDCTLFVRDESSYDYVRSVADVECLLCPDMAHALWNDKDGIVPDYSGRGTLNFFRKDIEASGAENPEASIDWDDLIAQGNQRYARYLLASLKRCPSFKARALLMRLWEIKRDEIVKSCVSSFRPYREIVTDRLHGMILGCLLGKKVEYIDNSYGKLSRYVASWLHDLAARHEKFGQDYRKKAG